MSKADVFRAYCLTKNGIPYERGEEFDHPAGPILTVREDGDCSGIYYAGCVEAKVLVNGRPVTRETADTYWGMATAITQPSRVGDCCWFPKTGHKTHMAVYIGRGEVIEAGNHGPGGVYPGHGYVGLCTIAEMDARHPVWGRLNTDIGELTEGDVDEARVRAIVKEMMDQTTSKEGDEAQKWLLSKGVLTKPHDLGKLTANRFLLIMLRRLWEQVFALRTRVDQLENQ